MTREEAIEAAVKAKEKWGGGSSEYWLVIVLEALGVLKLDEPKSTNEQFRSAVREVGVHLSELTIKSALKKSGLKLVPRGCPQEISDAPYQLEIVSKTEPAKGPPRPSSPPSHTPVG